jgi:hypothetical protein
MVAGRTLMDDTNDEDRFYNEHAALLGHVTLAWNDCQSMVMQIFHTLSGTSWVQSTSVFLSLKSDQSQRDITIALLLAVLDRAGDDPIRQLGTSLVGQLGSLAGERNAATHTMWITVMPSRKVEPHPAIPKPKMLKPDFKSQFENLTQKLRKLFRELLNYDAALRLHLEQTRKNSKKLGNQDLS